MLLFQFKIFNFLAKRYMNWTLTRIVQQLLRQCKKLHNAIFSYEMHCKQTMHKTKKKKCMFLWLIQNTVHCEEIHNLEIMVGIRVLMMYLLSLPEIHRFSPFDLIHPITLTPFTFYKSSPYFICSPLYPFHYRIIQRSTTLISSTIYLNCLLVFMLFASVPSI